MLPRAQALAQARWSLPSLARTSRSPATSLPKVKSKSTARSGAASTAARFCSSARQGGTHCASLLLGDKSQVSGRVIAEDIVVRGRVVGSVRGLRVPLQAQSHVEGDIFHQSLAIEQGAYFEGKSRRSDDPLAEVKA